MKQFSIIVVDGSRTMPVQIEDLTRYVDFTHRFRLSDVLKMIVLSDHFRLMSRLLRCVCLGEILLEASKASDLPPVEADGEKMVSLSLTYRHSVLDKGGAWEFFGVGEKGTTMAIDFLPVNQLVNLPIYVDCVVDEGNGKVHRGEFVPPLTLIELFDSVVYGLSFFGDPKTRDEIAAGVENELSGLDGLHFVSEEVFQSYMQMIQKCDSEEAEEAEEAERVQS